MGRHDHREHLELSTVVRAHNKETQHDKFLYILKGPDGALAFYDKLKDASAHHKELFDEHNECPWLGERKIISCHCFEVMYCLRPNTVSSWLALVNEVADPVYLIERAGLNQGGQRHTVSVKLKDDHNPLAEVRRIHAQRRREELAERLGW